MPLLDVLLIGEKGEGKRDSVSTEEVLSEMFLPEGDLHEAN